ncbi:MAG: tryptophan--tRNA ligase [Microthrixaceae bacterium]
MARVFSGIQPSGALHLGNYLGAIANWVRDLDRDESLYCIVDLHALTNPQDPELLRARTRELAAWLVACGLDPERCVLFVQSHVPEHTQLAWLVECTVSYGELSRMTQFKEKADRQEFVSGGLFTYPALMAADVLLYDTEKVPVGADQKQHIELCRDAAERFNHRYGDTFVVPEHSTPTAGARVMDLQDPTSKMSKSTDSPQGVVMLSDPPSTIERKFKRAVTDSDADVRFDVEAKPGVSNLLSILAALTRRDAAQVASDYSQYGPLKADCAAAVIDTVEPIRERFAELTGDPAELERILASGAERARALAAPVLLRAQRAIGLR